MPPRSKDSIKPHLKTFFECLRWISGHIKGPMASHLQGTAHVDQLAASLLVDSSIRREDTQYKTIDTQLLTLPDVAFHRMKFIARVVEIPSTRPDHHIHINIKRLTNNFDTPNRRSCSSLRRIVAKLNAISAAFLRFQRRLDIIYDHLYSHAQLSFVLENYTTRSPESLLVVIRVQISLHNAQ